MISKNDAKPTNVDNIETRERTDTYSMIEKDNKNNVGNNIQNRDRGITYSMQGEMKDTFAEFKNFNLDD